MKWIEYDYVCNENKGIVYHKKVEYNEANLAIAQREAVNGEYTITEDDAVIEIQPLAIEFGGTGAKTAEEARQRLNVQRKHIAVSVTLFASAWPNNSQTVAAEGVTATNTIIVAADPSFYSDYSKAGIYCSAQADGSLTFTCNLAPSIDVKANVMIFN